MKIISLRKGHCTAAISMLLVVLAIATLMAGIVGCASRPAVNAIKVRTWYDLSAIGNNMSANYILENDLDATTDGYEELASPAANGGKGWKPIRGVNASQPEYFTGVFEGQGHGIKDLFINRPDEYRVGLFHYLNLAAAVRNVGLVNATVTGGERVGALAGQVAFGTVSNCYFTGTVAGNVTVGGLVAGIWNAGTVTNCYGTGSVSGNTWVGGLAGCINDGTVSGSYCTGSATGSGSVGDLVGYIIKGTVTSCHATGGVTGVASVGGLVGGIDEGTITNSYCTGSVTGNVQVGGLVGGVWSAGVVTNCHATGNVTGVSYVGGLVGHAENVTDSYATGSVTGSMEVGGLAGTAGTITNCYATGNVIGTGSGAIGGLVGWHRYGTVSYSYSTGNVTGNYSGGLVGVNGYNWLSFGPMALTIDDTVAVYYSYSTGSVTGSICVGGLVGENYLDSAVVGYSYSTGSAAGNNMTGGLVGFNAGNVTESYATSSVIGSDCVGGLVGSNKWGTVRNSYSTGSVAGNSSVGGLVGYGGTVSSSFWDTQTSGQNVSAGGTGKNTTEMKDFTTFSAATWNITTVANLGIRNLAYMWNIVDHVTYPFLSWQPAS